MRRITITFPWPLTVSQTQEMLSFVFQVTLSTYLAFILIENLEPGFISTSLSLNSLLWWVIIIGIIAILWPRVTEKNIIYSWTKGMVLQICVFSLFSSVAVILQTREVLGKHTLLLAVSVGLIVAGVFYLLCSEGKDSRSHLPSSE